ncbi:antibiotic biosynthesis monooxygenase [Streptomyces sp. ME19-01-6]|uniref:antibiotic biosynthesis monooxygenase n=1 Tax=Streptomyces sp. ME19-01-6 TaxID=3028686 RepID=UPI0029B7C9B2|nr:antibiotic biosynthesis monooxygenase [Streptomyces sp. ME19-01-6]MDX3225625.1 antibiotic biosynthesis monooxygenase [Streptomyces sp. ME19-01-6]
MPGATSPLPDLSRPDVGAALFSTWSVGTPERQRATVDALAASWNGRSWPTPELLSQNVYVGTDGDTLMHHSQWTSEEAYLTFVRAHRQARVDEIDAAVPGIERNGIANYRRYRGFDTRTEGDPRVPGCIVAIKADFDDPDPDLRRKWIDLVIEALETDPAPSPGLISADFHLIVSGARHLANNRVEVLNYAQWTSEEAYDAAIAADDPTPEWERVRHFPGFKGTTAKRYRFERSFVRP